jgi:hypothetical protein
MYTLATLPLLSRSACHAANRIAPVDSRPRCRHRRARQGRLFGARSQSSAHLAGVGPADSRVANHGGAGRRTDDGLAHPCRVPRWWPGPGTSRRPTVRTPTQVRHRDRSAGRGPGLHRCARGQRALDAGAFARGHPRGAGIERDQPRDRSPAAKKTASNLGAK